MQPKDRGYLWDMVTACDDIIDFVREISADKVAKNKLIRFAVERQLIVV